MYSRLKVKVVAAAMMLGLAIAPAMAQQRQGGLVNVAIGDITTGDILSNNRVGIGVAANIAANVCGTAVQVGVLASVLAHGGSFDCNNVTDSFVSITQ